MKRINVTVILMSLIITSTTCRINAQNLAPVLEAINELEQKLTKMVQNEKNERATADNKIRKELTDRQPSQSSDDALAKTIEELKSALLDVRTSQKKLNNKLSAITDSLIAISTKGEDERIKEMASGLKKLIDELKTAMELTDEGQEAMELGGVITLDIGMDPSDAANISAEIGEVNLSAVVNLADNLTAFIALLAEGNLGEISIDEALVEWRLADEKITLVGGQHALYHGLLSTHLVSDPLIIDNVELIAPGITSAIAFKSLTCALGAAFIHTDADVADTFFLTGTEITREEVVFSPEENYFAGVVTFDYSFFDESAARLSMLIYKETISFDVGTGLLFGPVSLDLEWFNDIVHFGDMETCGLYGGVAVAPTDIFETAFRYDALSPNFFDDIEHRIGIGASFGLPHDLFIAAEYGYHIDTEGKGTSEIAFQFGLESTVKLPGFQRKTLTQK